MQGSLQNFSIKYGDFYILSIKVQVGGNGWGYGDGVIMINIVGELLLSGNGG